MIRFLAALSVAAATAGCARGGSTERVAPNLADPPAQPGTTASAGDWFEDRAEAAGVNFQFVSRRTAPLPVLYLMGTGCAAVDLDGDHRSDLLFVGQEQASPGDVSALYRNAGGGRFEDVTATSGLDAKGMLMGCAVADLDGDALPEILLTGYGINRLYKNLGGMRFEDVTEGSGLQSPAADSWHSSAAFFDYDRDGDLDLYIGRYVVFNKDSKQLCQYGKYQGACGPLFYDPQQGSLYRNEGGFRFREVTREMGLAGARGKCLGVAVCDTNRDGWPDFYLANDEMPADLYINQKGKRFVNTALESGVELAADGQMQGGMGTDFGDLNRDGEQDLIVTTFENEADSLYVSSGRGMYTNASLNLGIDQPSRMPVGFGAKFADFDNDGWPDIAITNGHIRDNQDLLDALTTFRQPMQLYMSDKGVRFEEQAWKCGPSFTAPMVGRGLATSDLDDDGKVDVVVTDAAGKARVLYNRTPGHGNWVRIRLEGKGINRLGIGARAIVRAGGKTWTSECTSAGSYLSASDPRLHFGLGDASRVESVTVIWPSGKRTTAAASGVNRDIVVAEP